MGGGWPKDHQVRATRDMAGGTVGIRSSEVEELWAHAGNPMPSALGVRNRKYPISS